MSEDTAERVTGALDAFGDAVHALIGMRPDVIERDDFGTQPIVLDSLYVELTEAKHGERLGRGGRRPPPASKAPGWTDALSLLDRIDRQIAMWWPETPADTHGHPPTVRRLYALLDYGWRPQDVGELQRMTRELTSWADRIRALLPTEETHTWELRAACPACGVTTTEVDDGTGELVRQYVLQADKSSARCAACAMNWAPEQYQFLARLLGSPLAEGVLE